MGTLSGVTSMGVKQGKQCLLQIWPPFLLAATMALVIPQLHERPRDRL